MLPTSAAHGGAVASTPLHVAPLFDAAPGASAYARAPEGPLIWAWHDGTTLHLSVVTEGEGWVLVALDGHAPRKVPMTTGTMDARAYLGALVDGSAAAPVVFSRMEMEGHASNGEDGSVERIPASSFPTTVLREDGRTTTTLEIPMNLLGGPSSGTIREIFVAWSDHATPPTYFLGERPHQLALVPLYVGAAGEDLAALAAAFAPRGASMEGLAAASALAALSGGAALALVLRGERAPAGTGRGRLLAGLTAAAYPSRSDGRALWRVGAVLAVALMLSPLAQAQFIAGPLPPAAPQRTCGDDADTRRYDVSAIDIRIPYNRFGDEDPEGMMYVLDENIPALRDERRRIDDFLNFGTGSFPTGAEDSLFVPLVLRAHLGDCIEIRFTNRLLGNPIRFPEPPHAEPHPPAEEGISPVAPPRTAFAGDVDRRASIHVHGLALDPRVSEGSATGLNPDSTVAIGQTRTYRVVAAEEGVFFFHDHADPTAFGVASIRGLPPDYIGSNTHGLFGAVVVEPPGSTWRHPSTGADVRDGWKADILVPGGRSFREFVVFYHDPQVRGPGNSDVPEPMADHGLNYRVETMSRRIFQDDARCPAPRLEENGGHNPCQSPALVYSSFVHGDPGTPITRAYVGEDVKMRLVHGGQEETHAHHLHNHRWRGVDGSSHSTYIDSQSLSPSETFTQTLHGGAGGEGAKDGGGEGGSESGVGKAPGDSIFHCHLFPHLYGGMWGINRVHDRREPDLLPLPEPGTQPLPKEPGKPGFPDFMSQQLDHIGQRPPRPPQTEGLDPRTGLVTKAPGAPYIDHCPPTAPVRRYHVVAFDERINFNRRGDFAAAFNLPDSLSQNYALAEDEAPTRSGARENQPLVLRANKGDCISIFFENHEPQLGLDPRIGLTGTRASIHPHLHQFDVLGSDGLATGWNFDTGIEPGENITYRYYADEEVQTVVWHDHTSGLRGALGGGYGATIIEPAGATWRDPKTGGPMYHTGEDDGSGYLDSSRRTGPDEWAELWRADIMAPDAPATREFFLSIQDFMPVHNKDNVSYRPNTAFPGFDDFGLMGFNYRSEPLLHRTWAGPERVFDSDEHGDPSTPLLEAYPGDPVVVRYHQVPFEEAHSFTIQGHRWRADRYDPGSQLIDTYTSGVSEAFNAYLDGGAGGPLRVPGDYLYRGGSVDDMFAGAWGILRVHDAPTPSVLPLPDAPPLRPAPAVVDPCPSSAPVKRFDVHAVQKEIVYNGHGDHDMLGMMYVMGHHVDDVRAGRANSETSTVFPEPMTLRVNEGDCVKVRLTNDLPEHILSNFHANPQPTGASRVFNLDADTTGELLATPHDRLPRVGNRTGLFTHMLLHDVRHSGGVSVGYNPDSIVSPGETRTYTYYADTATVGFAFVEDMADPLTHKGHGLFGGIFVMPRGARALNPVDGHVESHDPVVDVVLPNGTGWRDVALYPRNGIPLTSPDGHPVPQRESESPQTVDAGEAAQRALYHVRLVYGEGTDERARVHTIRLVEEGWAVLLSVDGWHFRVVVRGDTGSLASFESARDPRWLGPGGLVEMTNTTGAPLVGQPIELRHGGRLIASATTGADGVAVFPSVLPRAAVLDVRLAWPDAVHVDARTDSEGRFQLTLRSDPTELEDLETAADAARDALERAGLPAGGLGIASVDTKGPIWRVEAQDALRVYQIELSRGGGSVKALGFDSRARSLATPSYLEDRELERTARSFLKMAFDVKDAQLVESSRDRFGVWRVELDTEAWAHTLRLDGATGRILSLLRVPAEPTPLTLLSGASETTLRLRSEDGRPLAGTLVTFHKDGKLLGEVPVQEDGRTPVDPRLLSGPSTPTDIVASVPTLELQFPWNVQPRVEAYTRLDGLAATSLIKPSLAIDIARTYLLAHQPRAEDGDLLEDESDPDGEFGRQGKGGGTLPRGLVELRHGADGWRVRLGNEHHVVDVLVDDTTGDVERLWSWPWATPEDHCSGEPLEHFGPHAPPACPWSFTVLDEEDQGVKGFNYRSEPFAWRALRHADPAYLYSTAVHGDPMTPVLRAYVGDPMRIHLASAMTKPRAGAFSVSGHTWTQLPGSFDGPVRQGQGGITPGRVVEIALVAGGPEGHAGDYLVQGAPQRHESEMGQWGILRVLSEPERSLRPLPSGASELPGRSQDGGAFGPTCPADRTITLRAARDPAGKWSLLPGPDLGTYDHDGAVLLVIVPFGAPHLPRLDVDVEENDDWDATLTPLPSARPDEERQCLRLMRLDEAAPPFVLKIEATADESSPVSTPAASAKDRDDGIPAPGSLGVIAILAALALLGRRRTPPSARTPPR